jgi:hypothetical protein
MFLPLVFEFLSLSVYLPYVDPLQYLNCLGASSCIPWFSGSGYFSHCLTPITLKPPTSTAVTLRILRLPGYGNELHPWYVGKCGSKHGDKTLRPQANLMVGCTRVVAVFVNGQIGQIWPLTGAVYASGVWTPNLTGLDLWMFIGQSTDNTGPSASFPRQEWQDISPTYRIILPTHKDIRQ